MSIPRPSPSAPDEAAELASLTATPCPAGGAEEVQENADRIRAFLARSCDEYWCAAGTPIPLTGSLSQRARTLLDSFRIVECNQRVARQLGTPTASGSGERRQLRDLGERWLSSDLRAWERFFQRDLNLSIPRDDPSPAAGIHLLGFTAGGRLTHVAATRAHCIPLEERANVARLSTAGQLAETVAHELNQPLAAIMNYARGSARRLRDAGCDPEVIEAVEETATQAERAGEIVRRLRQVIRRESGPRRPHSINRILREASELVLDEMGSSPVRVEFDLEAYPDSVVVDRAQIQQVVVNLSCNALEAMAGHEAAGRLRIGSRRESYDRIRVEIEDDGPGVRDRAHLSQLFSPWFTTKPDGAGLGLSVCRSVIEAHGGLLSYSDAPHGGALFHFTLPSQSN